MLKFLRFGIVLLIFGVLSGAYPVPARAQGTKFTLSGVVRDSGGKGIPGVMIQLKGTYTGTVTGPDGSYSVVVPNDKSTLVASFLGYKSVEMFIGTKRTLDLVLEEEAAAIEDVVVVGYGVQKKASVVGAISSVDSKELLKSSSTSLANALSGRVSGLSASQTMGGQPGVDDAKMYLRGASTLNTTDPLVLIDGVPRDNIRTIDPNEVESVSVLKDASATAVFGVRGANGVIMITTRRGQQGKASLSVNVNQSFAAFTRRPARLHSTEYLGLRNEALRNDGRDEIDPKIVSMYENPLQGLDPSDPDYASKARTRRYMYPDHDYYGMIFKKFAPQTTVNANVSGGTERLSYFLNAGFIKQGGHLNTESKKDLGYDPSSRMDRWSFRANLDYKITKSLKAFLNIGTYIEKVGMPGIWAYGDDSYLMMRGTFFYTTLMLPTTPGPLTIDGNGAPTGQVVNPTTPSGDPYMPYSTYETINRFGYYRQVKSNLNSTFGIDWDLGAVTKGLTLRGLISYDAYSGHSTSGVVRNKRYDYVRSADLNSFSYSLNEYGEIPLTVYRGVNTLYKINAQAILGYNRSFGRHNVGAMLVAQRDYWESTGAELPYNVIGVSGRVTYNYDDRYFAEFNMGYNGSEQFSPDKRFGFFPAASVGWVVSNEEFLRGNDVLTFLKLRASYGKVGNDQQGSQRFLYEDQITVSGGGYLPSLGLGQHVVEGLLGNHDVTWETASKYNIGVDFNLFGGLSGSFDFYKERRSDILISRETVPIFQGIPQGNIPRVNIGEVDNKGLEVELAYNKEIFKGFLLHLKGNFGYNKNKVIYADEVPLGDKYAYKYRKTGYSLGQHFGYLIDYSNNGGYWTKEALAETDLTYEFGQPRPGDFVYKDLNDDNVINEADYAPIGNGTVPRFTYGFSLGFDFKGIDFSVFFQGLGGYHGQYLGNLVFESVEQGSYYDYHRHAWTEERWLNGDKITYPALSTGGSTSQQANSFFIQDKTFLRLKNIELGYTLPRKITEKARISNLRIYVSGQNLATWTRLKMTHLDPEPTDPMSYPVTKTITVGLNVSF